jgi:hypothetical protein
LQHLVCYVLLLQTIMHSFLGVGAPEAILVAVVALVVFGPKGLADVSARLLPIMTCARTSRFQLAQHHMGLQLYL